MLEIENCSIIKNGSSKELYEEGSEITGPDDYLNIIIKNEELEDLPCSKCNGDCCGPVPFKLYELEYIFKKYGKNPEFKKRFKANPKEGISKKLIKIQRLFGEGPEDGGLIISFHKKVDYIKNGINQGSCIFKRDEKIGSNHCMIYEDRPLICKAYGRKSIACPYAGLKEQPTGFVKEKLVNDALNHRKTALFKTMINNIKI